MSPVRLAPGAFVLLWSTGYIGVRYGLPAAPRVADRGVARDAVVGGLLLHGGLLGGTFYALPMVYLPVWPRLIGLQPALVAVPAARVWCRSRGSPLTPSAWHWWFGRPLVRVKMYMYVNVQH